MVSPYLTFGVTKTMLCPDQVTPYIARLPRHLVL